MQISEIKDRLEESGISLPIHTLRRRMNTYLRHTSRNHKNNFRDISSEEFQKLLLSLAMEAKGKSVDEVEALLEGKIPKVTLLSGIMDCVKVDEVLKRWVEE